MIRFTWMRFRTQALVVLGLLAVVATVLAVTGPNLAHQFAASVATCGPRGDCSVARAAFLNYDRSLQTALDVLVVVVPGILGAFWGAPLVAREFEFGTHRLGWTQSVTRTRWLAVNLGAIGLASIVVAGLLSFMVTWWASPLVRAGSNMYGSFEQRDLVPLGYAVFAFVVGVVAGLLIRRTLPAMAVTVVVFVTARISMTTWIRPLLMTPLHQRVALNPSSVGYGFSGSVLSLLFGRPASNLEPSAPHIPNAWIYSTRIIDKFGVALTNQVFRGDCPDVAGRGSGAGSTTSKVPAAVRHQLHACVAKVGATYHEVVTFQPANRYWAFQWYEFAIYIGVALVLGGACIWWIRRGNA